MKVKRFHMNVLGKLVWNFKRELLVMYKEQVWFFHFDIDPMRFSFIDLRLVATFLAVCGPKHKHATDD